MQVTAYCDDPLRIGELELEVGIIRNRHEFRVAQSARNGMISVGEVDYLQIEHLSLESRSSSKCDRQGAPPEG